MKFDLTTLVLSLALVALVVVCMRLRKQLGSVAGHQGELRRLNQRIERGIEGMGAALWEWNLQDDSIYLSDRFLEITGNERLTFGEDSVLFFEKFHPDERPEVHRKVRSYLNREIDDCSIETRFLHHNTDYVWVRLKAVGNWDENDQPMSLVGSISDITVQKEAEQQLLDHQERLRSLSNQLSLVEDRQRRELATAIHDGLAQQLFGIRAQMVLLKYPDKVDNLEDIVGQIIAILDETMADARSLSFELFPPVLYEVGLAAALTWLAHNYTEKTGINCISVCEGSGDELPEDLRSMAYQCVRELLANVTKHAQADEVQITLTHADQFLTVAVQDNGGGFDVNGQRDSKGLADSTGGFGLFSIRERLRSAEGRVLVDSKPGQGTRVVLSLPRKSGTAGHNPMDQGEFLG